MPTSRFAPLMLLGLALCIAAGTSSLMVSEAAPYLAVAGSEGARFEALARGELSPGPSVVSKKLVLDECYTAIISLYGKVQPTERRAQMLNSCHALAAGITTDSPSYAYGWYLMALADSELHDQPGLNAALAQAQATAPNEGWLGQLRVDFAVPRLAQLDPPVRDGVDRDLSMLAASIDGVDTVAQVYVNYPDLREHITTIVDALDDDSKRRFLIAVRHATPTS